MRYMARPDEQLLAKATREGIWVKKRKVGDHRIFEADNWHLIITPGKVHLYTFEGENHLKPRVCKLEAEDVAKLLDKAPAEWSELVESISDKSPSLRWNLASDLLHKTHGADVADNYLQLGPGSPYAKKEAPAMPIREHEAAELGFELKPKAEPSPPAPGAAPPKTLPPGTFELNPEEFTSLLKNIHGAEVVHNGVTYRADVSIAPRAQRVAKFRLDPVGEGAPQTMSYEELTGQGIDYRMLLMGEVMLPGPGGKAVPYRLGKILVDSSDMRHFIISFDRHTPTAPAGIQYGNAGSLALTSEGGKIYAKTMEGIMYKEPQETMDGVVRKLLEKAGVKVPEEEAGFEAVKPLQPKKANLEWLLEEHSSDNPESLQELLRTIGGQHAGKYDIVSITLTGTGIEELTPEEFKQALQTHGVRTFVKEHDTGKEIAILDFGIDKYGWVTTKRATKPKKGIELQRAERPIVEILHSKLLALPPITWKNLVKRHFTELTFDGLKSKLMAIVGTGQEGYDIGMYTGGGSSFLENAGSVNRFITLDKVKELKKNSDTISLNIHHKASKEWVASVNFNYDPKADTITGRAGSPPREHEKALIRILHEKLKFIGAKKVS